MPQTKSSSGSCRGLLGICPRAVFRRIARKRWCGIRRVGQTETQSGALRSSVIFNIAPKTAAKIKGVMTMRRRDYSNHKAACHVGIGLERHNRLINVHMSIWYGRKNIQPMNLVERIHELDGTPTHSSSIHSDIPTAVREGVFV